MCYTHLPARRPVGAVVICAPLFLEASENYRSEMLLAEALIARGLAVQRFDYRGCGNSYGNADELTLGSAEEDCVLAAERLRERSGTHAVGVLGTRWAAFVAAGASGRLGARAVAFWEAMPDGRAFVDDLARTRALNDLLHDGVPHPAGYHQKRLAAGHVMSMASWRVTPPLVHSSRTESLAGRLVRPLDVRLVHGRGQQADRRRLAGDLEARGCNVTLRVLEGRVWWWAGANRLLSPGLPRSPLELEAEATAEWFAERLAS